MRPGSVFARENGHHHQVLPAYLPRTISGAWRTGLSTNGLLLQASWEKDSIKQTAELHPLPAPRCPNARRPATHSRGGY